MELSPPIRRAMIRSISAPSRLLSVLRNPQATLLLSTSILFPSPTTSQSLNSTRLSTPFQNSSIHPITGDSTGPKSSSPSKPSPPVTTTSKSSTTSPAPSPHPTAPSTNPPPATSSPCMARPSPSPPV